MSTPDIALRQTNPSFHKEDIAPDFAVYYGFLPHNETA